MTSSSIEGFPSLDGIFTTLLQLRFQGSITRVYKPRGAARVPPIRLPQFHQRFQTTNPTSSRLLAKYSALRRVCVQRLPFADGPQRNRAVSRLRRRIDLVNRQLGDALDRGTRGLEPRLWWRLRESRLPTLREF